MQQTLPWLVATVLTVLLVGLAARQLVRRSRPALSDPHSLPAKWDLLPRPVFNADERRLYRLLLDALPHHMVLAKLPLVRFCQPSATQRLRYWYGVLGTTQVGFAVCSANSRVLAAIDLCHDADSPPAPATRIKQSVLGACGVRYLRCQADHLPSIPELQLLVPQQTNASRGPQPAPGFSARPGAALRPALASAVQPNARRRERSTLWQDSTAFANSLFSSNGDFDTGQCEWEDAPAASLPAMVRDALHPPPLRH